MNTLWPPTGRFSCPQGTELTRIRPGVPEPEGDWDRSMMVNFTCQPGILFNIIPRYLRAFLDENKAVKQIDLCPMKVGQTRIEG